MLQSDNKNPSEDHASREHTPLFVGARGLAVKLLCRVEQGDAYLDKVLSRELARTDLNEPDRRLLNELATGVLRWQGKLDWVLGSFYHGEFAHCLPVIRNAMRVALYQILFLDKIPHSAAVNESVEIVKRFKGARAASVVNGVLRSILRKLDAIAWPVRDDDVPRYLSIMYSHPLWMVQRWCERFGAEETERLLEANNRRPRLSLRVNTMRSSVAEVSAQLAARGLTPEASPYLAEMIVLNGLSGIGSDPVFLAGAFTVQDEGAALAAKLAGAKPGMRAIDLCAAPGGKTTAMAEAMEGSGEIVAVDRYEAKLGLITETAARLGFGDMIHPTGGDATTMHLEPADVVLVDAPSSGLGVLAKKPDIKWKRTPEDIDEMAALQGRLLANAARMVAPGGHLIYTTCTTEPSENEDVVAEFLRGHPEFHLVSAADLLPESVVDDEGYLRTFPHRHGMDGTFGARMRRD